MTERDFTKILGRLEVESDTMFQFVDIIGRMMTMLDEADMDDYFGTEGWRYNFGWE